MKFFYAILFYSQILLSLQSPNNQLKWVFDNYTFPVFLTSNLNKDIDADYKWFRENDQIFIEEIDDYGKYFATETTKSETMLYLMDYDYQNHGSLGSYQAQIIGVRSSDNDLIQYADSVQKDFNENSDIFNIVFFKSHEINIEEKGDTIDYSCSVKVLLKKNDVQFDFLKTIENLVNQNIVIDNNSEINLAKNFKINIIGDDLLEITITKGPISINRFDKGLNKKYAVSCHLKLTDSDDSKNEAYKNSILKTIDINNAHYPKAKLSRLTILFISLFSIAVVILIAIFSYLLYTQKLCFSYRSINPTNHW